MPSAEYGVKMRRRDLITLVGGGVAAWPRVSKGQVLRMPTVGWLSVVSAGVSPAVPFFRQGLADAGYIEGRNVGVEYRYAEFHPERLPAMAADLVERRVAVLAAVSGAPTVLAARSATTSIPIVFITPGDPVKLGFVASIDRPGANVTGIYLASNLIALKQIEMMHELLPNYSSFIILSDPNSEVDVESDAQQAARRLNIEIMVVRTANESDFETAFAQAKARAAGLVIPDRPIFVSQHIRLAALAAAYAVPAIYPPADLASSGGLMSYGTSTFEAFRRAGEFVGKILAGAKPADLPVEQPSKVELKINLKTANALGIAFPLTLLARANEVIE